MEKMAKGCRKNEYEEARKQRLEENKKKLEDLRVSSISKDLTGLASSVQKSLCRTPKRKAKTYVAVEPRRSSRERNAVPSYREDVGMELPSSRKRSRSRSSWGSYIARPLEEIKEATDEERARAMEAAEALKNNLQSTHPSFVKSMVRSHVYSCFWLGLPTKFCEQHLPKTQENMVLEDENGSEYVVVYIGSRVGISGGWRGFALDHKLDDGDAIVFELVEALRFKVYIVRAFPQSIEYDGKQSSEKEGPKIVGNATPTTSKKKKTESNKAKKKKQAIPNEIIDSTSSDVPENNVDHEVKSKKKVVSTNRTRGSQEKSQKKSEEKKEAQVEAEKPKADAKPKTQANKAKKSEKGVVDGNGVPSKNGLVKFAEIDLNEEPVQEETKTVSKAPRKKSAPKLFRKRA